MSWSFHKRVLICMQAWYLLFLSHCNSAPISYDMLEKRAHHISFSFENVCLIRYNCISLNSSNLTDVGSPWHHASRTSYLGWIWGCRVWKGNCRCYHEGMPIQLLHNETFEPVSTLHIRLSEKLIEQISSFW